MTCDTHVFDIASSHVIFFTSFSFTRFLRTPTWVKTFTSLGAWTVSSRIFAAAWKDRATPCSFHVTSHKMRKGAFQTPMKMIWQRNVVFLRNKYFNALASGDLCRAFRNSLLTPGKLPWYSWKSFKVTARGLSLKPVKPLTLSRASCKALGILPLKTYSVAFCDGSSKESKSVRKHNASSKWVHNGRVQSKRTKQVLKTARRFRS